MAETILDMLDATVSRKADEPALGWIENGELRWRSWTELQRDVQQGAAMMRGGAGSGAYDTVALFGANSGGWIVCYLAILKAGLTVVPLHSSLSEATAQAEAKRFEAGLLRISRSRRDRLFARPLAEVGNSTQDLPEVRHDAIASIQPTSGTSGQPRGVMLTHANLAANTIAVCNAVGGDGNELRLSFLPFSHLYARVCDLYAWIYRGSRLVLAESRDTLFRDLQIVRPTSLNGVPYFYQKVLDRAEQQGVTVRDVLGGAVRQCFCGGAALSPTVQEEFAWQGVPLMSGYGLSEASPVVTASNQETNRVGTVGRPLDGVEVRLAGDGEVLVRGTNVMLGYWNDPQATAEVLRDGWLHTGDLGAWDEAGHLVIRGRKKEALVLSTGKNVSPSKIEALLGASPWIEQVCVVGEGRSRLAALIVPNPERVRAEIKRRRLWVWSRRRALAHPAIRGVFEKEVAEALAGCAPHEQIRSFTLLPRGFSIDSGEVTAKLSLRRDTIEQEFRREIEVMYASTDRERDSRQEPAST